MAIADRCWIGNIARVSAWVTLLLGGCVLQSFGQVGEETPEQVIPWRCAGKGWGTESTGGNSILAASVDPAVLEIWQWDGHSVKKRFATASDHVSSVGILPHDKWISTVFDDRHTYFCVGDVKTGKVTDCRRDSSEWNTGIGRGSRNGKYLGGWGYRQSDSVRFGLVVPDGSAFRWAVTTVASTGIRWGGWPDTVPSDDGAYIGVADVNNGVAMVDVAKEKVLWIASYEYKPGMRETAESKKAPWRQMPLDEISTNAIAFAPDSKLIYAGGATGSVFGLKVKTGEVVSRWETIASPNMAYVPRIESLAMSPDGRFVAAGTAPDGLVFLFTTNNGRCRVLRHGGSKVANVSLISFSPDSKRLASFAAGQIKIWKLPQEATEPKPDKPAAK